MKSVTLPEVGENIEKAEVVSVLVSEGDQIEEDQPILEIETDKATLEVPSSASGTVVKLYVKQGDEVEVGQTVADVEESGNAASDKGEEKSEKDDDEKSEKKSDEKSEKKSDEKSEKKSDEKSEKKSDEKKSKPQYGDVFHYELPELGENIEEAEVVGVLVEVGDRVEKEQPLLEIETDKATIEAPSTVAGVVKEILVKKGEKAKVGQLVMKIETSEAPEEEASEEATAEKKSEPTASGTEKKSEPTASGKEEKKSEPTASGKEEKKSEPTAKGFEDGQPPIQEKPAPAAPSVRRLAREIGVDINRVEGSGPGGRISMDDVKAHSKRMNEGRVESGGGGGLAYGIEPVELPDFSKFGEIERTKMPTIRKRTAERLSYAWATIPHVTQHDKADTTELERARKQFGDAVKERGGKLTLTALLVKILGAALKEFPQFNASVDMAERAIIYKKYYNVGVAADTPKGLLVPVLKNVHRKSVVEIAVELTELSKKARDGKLGLDEMQGSCMSISNLGGLGGTYFTPVVNPPEVAILGVSRGAYEPVFIDGEFEARLMTPLSLSYDHRVIDGADAVRFLRWIVEAMENPFKLALEA
ncbi:MAG: dihydrolipoyllysine-residue acetyltransferase [Ignavibacteriales bacterium]|nr:dihydrolipoyllysine-residue acetyltransferase [Ignavibacteriales bacterium]